MKKDFAVIGGLLAIVLVLLVFGRAYSPLGFISQTPNNRFGSTPSAQTKSKVEVSINQLMVTADVAANQEARRKGLSGKQELAINSGMLFVFDKNDSYAIWMKDMKIAIDIIWLDDKKKVVDFVSNVSPEPGKSDKELTIYRPQSQARYVLEVNAGLVKLNNVKVGDLAAFDL